MLYAVNTTDILRPELYKSVDSGENWTHTELPDTGRLAVDPQDGNILYMGSYKSTDGGQTWTMKTNGLPEYPSP